MDNEFDDAVARHLELITGDLSPVEKVAAAVNAAHAEIYPDDGELKYELDTDHRPLTTDN